MTRPARTQFIDTGKSSWMEHAACLGEHVDAAFPIDVFTARAFIRDNCDRCPVLDSCAAFAAAQQVEWGIWGGRLLGKDGGTDDGL